MIIADTGAFVALFNRRDTFHSLAEPSFSRCSEPLITTYPVLAETCYLLSQIVSRAAEQKFLEDITQGAAEIFHIQKSHLTRMIILMKKYEDLPMDFADASLVLLAEQLGHGRILTVDRRDFNIYRWNDTQPFENLFLAA